jgi:hypothetical protein
LVHANTFQIVVLRLNDSTALVSSILCPLCPDSRPWQDLTVRIPDCQTWMSPFITFPVNGREHNLDIAAQAISDELGLTRKVLCIASVVLCHPAASLMTGSNDEVESVAG